MHKGKEYIFRLCFVDCPEAEDAVPERVDEQAEYFGVSREHILKTGRAAARFTASTLRGSFTVHTEWMDAKGDSQLQRFFAVVIVDGKDLAELLAANGLCRVYGKMVNRPDGPSMGQVAQKLDSLAQAAKRGNRGIWGKLDADAANSTLAAAESGHDGGTAVSQPSIPTSSAPPTYEKVTCPGRATAYTPRPPFKPIGSFEAGTALEIIARLPDAMVQVRFTSPAGKVTYASCKYFELGLAAE
jgi:endonuclease YncB( thermonuclease family)